MKTSTEVHVDKRWLWVFFGIRSSVSYCSIHIYVCLHSPAAIQWKESARANRAGRDYTAMRPALMVSMVMAAWSRVFVWMEGCVMGPQDDAIAPRASRSVVE